MYSAILVMNPSPTTLTFGGGGESNMLSSCATPSSQITSISSLSEDTAVASGARSSRLGKRSMTPSSSEPTVATSESRSYRLFLSAVLFVMTSTPSPGAVGELDLEPGRLKGAPTSATPGGTPAVRPPIPRVGVLMIRRRWLATPPPSTHPTSLSTPTHESKSTPAVLATTYLFRISSQSLFSRDDLSISFLPHTTRISASMFRSTNCR
mmetsp:Transcript_26752/g.60019  ORF Transcript_26752/g.60019 Transcript_26752/m.60019 type:complete len:209 (-) Transcript_26752:41-667(-)